MKRNYIIGLVLLFSSVVQAQELIFRSGFEPGTTVVDQTSAGADIIGTDTSVASPNIWTTDLEDHPNIGKFNLQYQDKDANQQEKRRAEIINDPTGRGQGKVLNFWATGDNASESRARVQANCYGSENGIFEYYQRVKLYLPSASFEPLRADAGGFDFLTILEIWNDNNFDPPFGTPNTYPFRMKVNITKQEGSGEALRLTATGEEQSRACCWGEGPDQKWSYESDFIVPFDKWLDIEVYIKEGNATDGRFRMAVTPEGGARELVFDVTGWTHHSSDPDPDGIKFFNPLKLYTLDYLTIDKATAVGERLEYYWDDLELWKNKQINLPVPANPPGTPVPPSPVFQGVVWCNVPFNDESGTFTAKWDMIPDSDNMDGVTALAAGDADSYSELACIVRCNSDGTIDARNGNDYAADTVLSYSGGASYAVEMEVDINTKKYSVFVTPPNGNKVTIGSNFDFRSDQASVALLNRLVINTEDVPIVTSNFGITRSSTPNSGNPLGNGTTTLLPVADAFANSKSADTNYGEETEFVIQPKQSENRVGYLKFDLSDISGNVEEATLRIYNTEWNNSVTDVSIAVQAVNSDAWSEDTLTWSNRPDASGSDLALAAEANGGYTELDVTDVVAQEINGDGEVSFYLYINMPWAPPYDMRANIFSRESDVNKPQLLVTTDAEGVDLTPPSKPRELTAISIKENSVTLCWNASVDDVGIDKYEVLVDTQFNKAVLGDPPTTITVIDGLDPGTTYLIYVKAADAAGNFSENSVAINVTTLDHQGVGNADTDTATLVPIADAFTNSKSPGTNYGAITDFTIQPKRSENRAAFLKFDVSDVPGTVENAVLRVFNTEWNASVTNVSMAVQGMNDDSWTEEGLHWTNRPSASGVDLDVAGEAIGGYTEFDVTDFVIQEANGDGAVSLYLYINMIWQSPWDMRANIFSRESEKTPQLVVTYRSEASLKSDIGMPESQNDGAWAYPNPVTENIFYVQVDDDDAATTLLLTDLLGRSIPVSVTKETPGTLRVRPGISLEKGVYLLSVRNSSGSRSQKLVFW